MDASAIKQLQDLVAAASGNSNLYEAGLPVIVLPDGHKIHSTESFGDTPMRHRENFKTQYLSEFVAYVNIYKNGDEAVFIDDETMQAQGIIDRSFPNAPTWQGHTASLKLQRTPALAALLKDNNRLLTQDELIDFAQDWKDHIVFFDGETPLSHNDALSRLRKLKISKSSHVESNRGDFKATASAIEQIAIDAADAPLPSHFEFRTEPYLEFDKYVYTGQLRALGDDNKPQLKYRLVGLPVIDQAISIEFKNRISAELPSTEIHIGTI